MKRVSLAVIGVAIIIVGVLASSSLFIVRQTEQALVLQFGEPKRVVQDARLAYQSAVYPKHRSLRSAYS